jgi:hypothetical protein
VRLGLDDHKSSRSEIKLDFLAISHDLVEETIADLDLREFEFLVSLLIRDEFAGVPILGLLVVIDEVEVTQLVQFAFVTDVIANVLVKNLEDLLIAHVPLERVGLAVQLFRLQAGGVQR